MRRASTVATACVVSALALALAAAPLAAATLGHWGLDEASGQTVADDSGNSNNGTLGSTSALETEDPAWNSTVQKSGAACLVFNASQDDWVRVPDSSSLDIAGAGAKVYIAVWIRPLRIGSNGLDYPSQMIMWKGDEDPAGLCNYYLEMRTTTEGQTGIRFGFKDSGGSFRYLDYPNSITSTGWHYVAGAYDSSNGSARVDVDSNSQTGNLGVRTLVANNQDLRIGRLYVDPFGLEKTGFHGGIDEVLVRNDYQPAAVEVADLKAVPTTGATEVRWRAPGPADLAGFHVWRAASDSEAWVRLNADLIAVVAAPEARAYSFRDPSGPAGARYRVDAVKSDGSISTHAVP